MKYYRNKINCKNNGGENYYWMLIAFVVVYFAIRIIL